ncbi:hypothetical protein Hanom_Chr12g01098991 [Helianthus anomalus]
MKFRKNILTHLGSYASLDSKIYKGPNYLHTCCVDRHLKNVFFCPYMHPLQCRTVANTRRFGPVNRIKSDGCLMGLLTGSNAELWPRFGPVTQTRSQSFVWLTGPKRGQSSAFWSGQQTRQSLSG